MFHGIVLEDGERYLISDYDGGQGQKYPIPTGTIEGGTSIETNGGQI
jgi:hypothetical protein